MLNIDNEELLVENGVLVKCKFKRYHDSIDILDDDNNTYEVSYIKDSRDEFAIPNGVETIGKFAFDGCHLKGVIIPDTVKVIGESAFEGNRLEKVTIPSSVKSIGDFAFMSNGLNEVELSNGLEEIGEAAFGYNHLASLTIPSTVRRIGDSAFVKNYIVNVNMPNSIEMGNDVFYGSQLSNEVSNGLNIDNDQWLIVNGVLKEYRGDKVRIERNKEIHTYPKKIIIPEGVTEIEDVVFYRKKLYEVIVPSSLKKVGSGAFLHNEIKNIILPKGIEIGESAFDENDGLNIQFKEIEEMEKNSTSEERLNRNIELLKKYIQKDASYVIDDKKFEEVLAQLMNPQVQRIGTLDERLTDIIRLRYGLIKGIDKEQSLNSIAQKYNVSTGRIRSLEDKALKMLGHQVGLSSVFDKDIDDFLRNIALDSDVPYSKVTSQQLRNKLLQNQILSSDDLLKLTPEQLQELNFSNRMTRYIEKFRNEQKNKNSNIDTLESKKEQLSIEKQKLLEELSKIDQQLYEVGNEINKQRNIGTNGRTTRK